MVITMTLELLSRAPNARRTVVACFAAAAWLMVAGLTPVRAEEGVFADDCLHSRGSVSCAGFWRDRLVNPNIIPVPQPGSEAAAEEAAERDRRWVARCRPIIRQDQYGVSRYHYAVPGCEYGKYE